MVQIPFEKYNYLLWYAITPPPYALFLSAAWHVSPSYLHVHYPPPPLLPCRAHQVAPVALLRLLPLYLGMDLPCPRP